MEVLLFLFWPFVTYFGIPALLVIEVIFNTFILGVLLTILLLFLVWVIEIATQLMYCETSKKLWDQAQGLAGAHLISRVIYLKLEFQSSKKGVMKTEEF